MSPAKCKPKELIPLLNCWNDGKYKYNIVEFTTLLGELNELDKYIFELWVRIGEYADLYIVFLLMISYLRQKNCRLNILY